MLNAHEIKPAVTKQITAPPMSIPLEIVSVPSSILPEGTVVGPKVRVTASAYTRSRDETTGTVATKVPENSEFVSREEKNNDASSSELLTDVLDRETMMPNEVSHVYDKRARRVLTSSHVMRKLRILLGDIGNAIQISAFMVPSSEDEGASDADIVSVISTVTVSAAVGM